MTFLSYSVLFSLRRQTSLNPFASLRTSPSSLNYPRSDSTDGPIRIKSRLDFPVFLSYSVLFSSRRQAKLVFVLLCYPALTSQFTLLWSFSHHNDTLRSIVSVPSKIVLTGYIISLFTVSLRHSQSIFLFSVPSL